MKLDMSKLPEGVTAFKFGKHWAIYKNRVWKGAICLQGNHTYRASRPAAQDWNDYKSFTDAVDHLLEGSK